MASCIDMHITNENDSYRWPYSKNTNYGMKLFDLGSVHSAHHGPFHNRDFLPSDCAQLPRPNWVESRNDASSKEGKIEIWHKYNGLTTKNLYPM